MMRTSLDYRKRVCRAMNHISRNLDRELSLEEIADVAAFSRFHFHNDAADHPEGKWIFDICIPLKACQ